MTKPKRTLADALQAAAKPKPATKTIPSRRGKRAWVIYLDRDAARRLKAVAAMSDRSFGAAWRVPAAPILDKANLRKPEIVEGTRKGRQVETYTASGIV